MDLIKFIHVGYITGKKKNQVNISGGRKKSGQPIQVDILKIHQMIMKKLPMILIELESLWM